MKKILHLALIAPGGYTNSAFIKAFFDNGFSEYHVFDYQLKMFEFGKETMREMLVKIADHMKPDMIFMQVQASDILDVATFKRLSEISFTVNYTFDIRSVEQTEWLYNLAPILGLICFSNQRDVVECQRRGYSNVMVLQSSCDMDVYVPLEGIQRKGVVFIGNNYENTSIEFPLSKDRVKLVDYLSREFSDYFKVYGNGWLQSRLTYQKEEIGIYQSALVAINQNNFDEDLYTSDRVWRIMATGAFCLTKKFKGVEKIFTQSDPLDWWEDFDELKFKLTYLLLNPQATSSVASRGPEWVRQMHTWSSRIKEVMGFFGELELCRDYLFVKKPSVDSCDKSGAHVIDGIIPQPFDRQFDGRTCDCGKLKWVWQECGCQLQEWQLRAQENI